MCDNVLDRLTFKIHLGRLTQHQHHNVINDHNEKEQLGEVNWASEIIFSLKNNVQAAKYSHEIS